MNKIILSIVIVLTYCLLPWSLAANDYIIKKSSSTAAKITTVDSTDTLSYIAMFDDATGDQAVKTDDKLTYNASTGALTASYFVGSGAYLTSLAIHPIGTFAAPITTNPYNLAAADSFHKVLYYGASGTINLPTLVAGMNICIYNTGAFTITIKPQDTDVLVIDGVANAAGHYMQLVSGAGNYVCIHADAAGHGVTMNANKGTLIVE